MQAFNLIPEWGNPPKIPANLQTPLNSIHTAEWRSITDYKVSSITPEK